MTVGFDDFDRWFWCFDSRFWCFWWFWQKVFVFEGCIINDSRFWCFWWFWQVVLMVLMFWQQVLMFLMILTEGSCFWRLYNKWQQVLMFLMILTEGFCFWRLYNKWKKVLSFEDAVIRKFPSHPPHPIAAYLGLCCEKLWSASPTNICSFKIKDDCL